MIFLFLQVLDHFYTNYGGVWTGCFRFEKSSACRGALAGTYDMISVRAYSQYTLILFIIIIFTIIIFIIIIIIFYTCVYDFLYEVSKIFKCSIWIFLSAIVMQTVCTDFIV